MPPRIAAWVAASAASSARRHCRKCRCCHNHRRHNHCRRHRHRHRHRDRHRHHRRDLAIARPALVCSLVCSLALLPSLLPILLAYRQPLPALATRSNRHLLNRQRLNPPPPQPPPPSILRPHCSIVLHPPPPPPSLHQPRPPLPSSRPRRSLGVFWSHKISGMPGGITRLLACSDDQAKPKKSKPKKSISHQSHIRSLITLPVFFPPCNTPAFFPFSSPCISTMCHYHSLPCIIAITPPAMHHRNLNPPPLVCVCAFEFTSRCPSTRGCTSAIHLCTATTHA